MQTIVWPGVTIFGENAVAQLGTQVQTLAKSHIFVLIDPGVRSISDLLDAAIADMTIQATYFDDVVGNPDAAHVDAAYAAYRDCGADCIVGVGGGSALDMAKGVKILAGSPEGVSVAEYLSTLKEKRRPNPAFHEMPPMVAIPTTSGTGSEVTPWGVVTDKEAQQKAGVGTNLIPDVALLDPHLTVSLPPHLTAATGMDALSHLIEAYVSTNAQKMLDPLILQGIKLIGENLRTAVGEPNNIAAREAMLEASMLGGVALSSNWLGAAHSLAHQLSTFCDIHHGLACSLMLPPQMRWSHSGAPERYADVAYALTGETGIAAAYAVEQLAKDINLPIRLSDCGVTADQIDTLSEFAFIDLNWWTNPIQPESAADLKVLYEATF